MADETETETKLSARVAANVTVTDALATAKNVATNGRLFCIMLAAANIAGGHPAMAVLAALPVGLSCLVDQISVPSTKALMSTLVYAFAAIVAVVSFNILW